MTADPPGGAARHLRRVAARLDPEHLTDGQLLDRFRTGRDEWAFAQLVRRHGPMVHAACRRVLRNHPDADDAFQAAFLVLARKADALAGRATVGDWLYGVAVRTALKARVTTARRRAHERVAAEGRPLAALPAEPTDWLDRELARLPARYREPVVLCLIEERPREEVAAALGIPEGTLASRLATARKRLADSLTRRGVWVAALAAGPVPAGLAGETVARIAAGNVPAAADRLATEVLRAMLLTKLRIGFGLTALAAGVLVAVAVARAPDEPKPARPPATAAKPADWKAEFRKAYRLADGEVLKRVPPPYPAARLDYFRDVLKRTEPAEEREKQARDAAASTCLVLRSDGLSVGQGRWCASVTVNGRPVGQTLTGLIASVLDRSVGIEEAPPPNPRPGPGGVPGPDRSRVVVAGAVYRPVSGDWVVRDGAAAENVVPRLEAILRDECKLPVTLELKEVEREVIVASGTYAAKPRAGREAGQVDAFAEYLTPADEFEAFHGRGDLTAFLDAVGGWVGKRIVNEATGAPAGRVEWFLHQRDSNDPKADAADRDADKVLANVAAQTGLTFKAEKRKVKVVCVTEKK